MSHDDNHITVTLNDTPDGVADSRVGDEIVTEIEGLGRLVNTIVGDAPAAS